MDNANPAPAYLGIEGGGTRTTVLLAPGDGKAVIRAEFGPANLRLLDDAALEAHFHAVDGIRHQASVPLAGIAIGMAGARTESDRRRIRAASEKVWPNVPCYATNDLETALAAREPDGDTQFAARILILSGTGSCCYGQTSGNATARLGGWGHILGDKGSGYEIGLCGLKAAVYYLDRDGKWTDLGRNILRSLQLNEPRN